MIVAGFFNIQVCHDQNKQNWFKALRACTDIEGAIFQCFRHLKWRQTMVTRKFGVTTEVYGGLNYPSTDLNIVYNMLTGSYLFSVTGVT